MLTPRRYRRFEPANPERFAAAQKHLGEHHHQFAADVFVVVGGFFAHSQVSADGRRLALIVGLASDVLVLYANRHGNRPRFINHLWLPCVWKLPQHLFWGFSLAAAADCPRANTSAPRCVVAVNSLALAIAIIALAAKEGMFRYMLSGVAGAFADAGCQRMACNVRCGIVIGGHRDRWQPYGLHFDPVCRRRVG